MLELVVSVMLLIELDVLVKLSEVASTRLPLDPELILLLPIFLALAIDEACLVFPFTFLDETVFAVAMDVARLLFMFMFFSRVT